MAVRQPRGVYARTLGDWFADEFAVWGFVDTSAAGKPGCSLTNNTKVGESYYVYKLFIYCSITSIMAISVGTVGAGTLGVAGNTLGYLDTSLGVPSGVVRSTQATLAVTQLTYPLVVVAGSAPPYNSAIGEPLAIVGPGQTLLIQVTNSLSLIYGNAFFVPITEVGPRPGSVSG